MFFWVNAYVDAPEYHAACAGLAKIYMKIGQTDKAENLIRKALNYKFSYRYLIALADILFMENDIDEAEKLYLQVLDNIKGSNEIIYRALSELYYRKKDFQRLQNMLKKRMICFLIILIIQKILLKCMKSTESI